MKTAPAERATLADVLRSQGLTGTEDPAALCTGLARRHYENFPVLSMAAPKPLRADVAALYAFCRMTDDLGDEAAGDRLALLDAWEADLVKAWGGAPAHPALKALAATVSERAIPPEPFRRLVRANRMDQVRSRWGSFEELRDYCRHSADPVGHMVLHALGAATDENLRLSDATCTALQLANFWQDVSRDLRDRGRIYLPADDMARFGVREDDLRGAAASPPLRRLMAFEVSRARALFAEGLGLADRLEGRARWMVAAFSAGGIAVLDVLAGQGYDPLVRRPALSGARKARLLLATGWATGWRLLGGPGGPAV